VYTFLRFSTVPSSESFSLMEDTERDERECEEEGVLRRIVRERLGLCTSCLPVTTLCRFQRGVPSNCSTLSIGHSPPI